MAIRWFAVAFVAVFLLAFAGSFGHASEASSESNCFPLTNYAIYLTATNGDVPETSIKGVPLMGLVTSGGMEAQAFFVPLLEGLGLSGNTVSWYYNSVWEKDSVICGDAIVGIYFSVNVEVLSSFTVELSDVDPDGITNSIAKQSREFSIQSLLPQKETFVLKCDGFIVKSNHTIKLTVTADGLDVLTWMRYDSESAPSGIESMNMQTLDLNGNGIPDSDESWYNNSTASSCNYVYQINVYPDASNGNENRIDGENGGLPDGSEAYFGAGLFATGAVISSSGLFRRYKL